MSRAVRIVLMLVALVARLADAGTPGQLDPTFATGGIFTAGLGGLARARGMLLRSDGAIVVGATTLRGGVSSPALLALDRSGLLDESFGRRGQQVLGLPVLDAGLTALLPADDGGMLAVVSDWGRGVVHLDAHGTPAAGYDQPIDSTATALLVTMRDAVRDDGDASIVAGTGWQVPCWQLAVARVLGDGSIDPTWGDAGSRLVDAGPGMCSGAEAIVRLADGGFVAAGQVYDGRSFFSEPERMLVARFDAHGALDARFGHGGTLEIPSPGGVARALAVTADTAGRILVGGSMRTAADGEPVAVVLRLLDDGTPDPAFGRAGTVLLSIGGATSMVADLAIDADGRVLAFATSIAIDDHGQMTSGQVALVRLSSDGSVDTGFGDAGVARAPVKRPVALARHVAVQPDGKIVGLATLLDGVPVYDSDFIGDTVAVIRWLGRPETCSGCVDDDGDGAVDLDDSSCCTDVVDATVPGARLTRKGFAVALHAPTSLTLDTTRAVAIQARAPGNAAPWCEATTNPRVHTRHGRSRLAVDAASSHVRLVLRDTPTHVISGRLRGPGGTLAASATGPLQLTIGLEDGNGHLICLRAAGTLRGSAHGALRIP